MVAELTVPDQVVGRVVIPGLTVPAQVAGMAVPDPFLGKVVVPALASPVGQVAAVKTPLRPYPCRFFHRTPSLQLPLYPSFF